VLSNSEEINIDSFVVFSPAPPFRLFACEKQRIRSCAAKFAIFPTTRLGSVASPPCAQSKNLGTQKNSVERENGVRSVRHSPLSRQYEKMSPSVKNLSPRYLVRYVPWSPLRCVPPSFLALFCWFFFHSPLIYSLMIVLLGDL